MSTSHKPFFSQALDALNHGDRRGAAVLLGRQLREGNTSRKNLPSVWQLASRIGEIELAIDAVRRMVVPGSIASLLAYCGTLASYGRSSEALAELKRQPAAVREDATVLHFRGSVETQFGRFDEAIDLFRRALAKAPTLTATWLSLAMIKKFASGDRDLAAMEELGRVTNGSPEARAPLFYAIGKARDDCGDEDIAFEAFSEGAALRGGQGRFNLAAYHSDANYVISQFTTEFLARLTPSAFKGTPSLFVTGLPRSGTTLTEEIVLGHSAVIDGAEVNLFEAALIPTLGPGRLANTEAYEQRCQTSDPWYEIARDYAGFINARFNAAGLVVDKSLGQSLIIGLLLHSIPDARIAWLRRTPDDVALSCFKTYFSSGLKWTCSLEQIADYMRIDDQLFDHWRTLFEDRILVVPYEQLTADPARWAGRLQQHFGLSPESAIECAPRHERAISTASVGQVREPISTARIGVSGRYERHLKRFRELYYR